MTSSCNPQPDNDAFLLSRPEYDFEDAQINELLREQRVIVTGAGGSIGSAVCRRLLKAPIQSLMCLDHSENAMFNVWREFKVDSRVQYSVHDIRHPLWSLFSNFNPTIVIHAAAYKHVGLMESQPREAFVNNCLGARYVATAAFDFVDKFLFVSTDKAARPSTNMGASKRLAELMILRHFPRAHVVRFGNVLGSSGSLVEILREQIDNGGPVTLTDPAMRRYFITAREAVGLILTSMLCFDPGFYSLDMGEPVSLSTIARKLMAACKREVPIVWTGKLLEEKINEDLLNPGESWISTRHPGIRQIRFSDLDFQRISQCLFDAEEVEVPMKEALEKLG